MATNDGNSIFNPSSIANSDRTSLFNCAQCLDQADFSKCQAVSCKNPNCQRCYCQGLYKPTGGTKAGLVMINVDGKSVPYGCSNCPAPTIDQCRNGELNNQLISQNNYYKSCSNTMTTNGSDNVIANSRQILYCDGEEMVNDSTIAGIHLPFDLTRQEVAIGGGAAAGLLILLLLI